MSNDLPRSFGTYTLLKLLARGGMGEIYLARTSGITGFEKYYAVKKLLKKFTHDNDVGARFIDEAKLGARLQHPNIVQVYDLGRVTDELYMATEFVDGFDLRRVLRFCHEKKKRIPLDIALFIVREILSGLAYAHRQVDAEGHSINLIHRDISPQNVLVSFEGEVKIIDFGLAKSTQRSQETQANVLLGNFGYMSPEQARGHPLDVRTDVYSAGIVLFELATGTKRFVEENPLRLLEMVARPTPIVPSDRVPGSPKTIDRIYQKATHAGRDERYESAEAFRDDITTALHKINPKASRENLAQFLSHLFLGGVAPAPVDADALDHSVAIRARDLHEAAAAFQTPSDADASDRRMHTFSDDAPQTGSHVLMRQARAGDTLTHEELTGEELSGPAAVALAYASERSDEAVEVDLTSQPPLPIKVIGDSSEGAPPDVGFDGEFTALSAGRRESHPAATATVASTESHVEQAPADPDAVDAAMVTAPHPVIALNTSDIDAPINETPTSIYDSPSWPGDLDRAAASVPSDAGAPAQEDVDVDVDVDVGEGHAQQPTDAPADRRLDLQAAGCEGEQQAVGPLEGDDFIEVNTAQAQALKAVGEHSAEVELRSMEEPEPPMSALPTLEVTPLDVPSGEVVAVGTDAATRPEVKRLEVAPRNAAPQAPSLSRGQTTVVSTLSPPPRRPAPTLDEQPSIVLALDLTPEVSSGGAPISLVRGGGASKSGFDTGEHESLIIDFDGDAEPSVDQAQSAASSAALPTAEVTSDKAIRPAAQPLGRRVSSTVVQPKMVRPATNPGRGHLAAEEPSGAPPSRRRN